MNFTLLIHSILQLDVSAQGLYVVVDMKCEIESRLGKEEVLDLLQRYTNTTTKDFGRKNSGKYFRGTFRGDTFKLKHFEMSQRGLVPHFIGHVEETEQGSRLVAEVKYTGFAKVFVIAWTTAAALMLALFAIIGIASETSPLGFRLQIATAPIALLSFGIFLFSFCYKKEFKITKTYL